MNRDAVYTLIIINLTIYSLLFIMKVFETLPR